MHVKNLGSVPLGARSSCSVSENDKLPKGMSLREWNKAIFVLRSLEVIHRDWRTERTVHLDRLPCIVGRARVSSGSDAHTWLADRSKRQQEKQVRQSGFSPDFSRRERKSLPTEEKQRKANNKTKLMLA